MADETSVPRIAFVLEQSLGHITHAQNLRQAVASAQEDKPGFIEPTYIEMAYADHSAAWSRLPLVRTNWSVRASLGARIALRNHGTLPDAAFFHSQITSLFSTGFMRHVPSVVSLDATPIQYDRMGALYGHAVDAEGLVSRLKKRMNERAFASAAHIVTWSQWTKDGLAEYGVAPEKVTVIPPGVDMDRWDFTHERAQHGTDGTFRLLFVGGDFARKGGETLLKAFAESPLLQSGNVQLDIVTKAEVSPNLPGIRVHRGLTPNSEALRGLFAQADLFVFPTEGDCLPLAILEALAAGLPIIATDVGAISEAVRDGETGIMIPAGDSDALANAIIHLKNNPALRQAMAVAARQLACERFDARKNYGQLLELLRNLAQKDQAS